MELKKNHSSNTNILSKTLWPKMDALAQYISGLDSRLNLLGTIESHAHTLNIFDNYPNHLREQIYNDFLTYSQIVKSALDTTNDLNDDLSLLWAVIKQLDLRPGDQLFSMIKPDDIIEVYRADGIQIYRNFNFHKICSYQYPELFIKKWDELFQRDLVITQLIQEAAFKVFSGQSQGILMLDNIPIHTMTEIDSPRKHKMKMEERFFFPLLDKFGKINYGVAVSKVAIVDKKLAKPDNYQPTL